MARTISLWFLAVASPLLLVLFTVPVPGAEELFAVLVMVYPVALIVLAVARNGRVGVLAIPLGVLLVFLVACAVAMLALRGQVLTAPWLGGLPLGAAVQLYGVWLAPLLLVALAYALTFDRFELRQEDLDRLLHRDRKPGNDR
jgi:hypothetical protein